MPYAWTTLGQDGDPGRPPLRLELWPHRSLPPRGFAVFIGITFALFMVPLLALIGSASFWEMLPFPLLALALTWVLLRRSYRARLREELTLTEGLACLLRTEADGSRKEWRANPYWVRVVLHPRGGPVENYLTLEGGPRVVEIGAFLGPDERARLQRELGDALQGRSPTGEATDRPG